MKPLMASSLLGASLLGLVLLQTGYSDEKAAPEKKADAAAKKDDSAGAPKTIRVRLPNLFGKLSLTTEQQDKIKAIGSKYGPQIADLRKQLQQLEAQQEEEQQAVLSGAQKEQLNNLKQEAKAKREAAKPAAAANDKPAAEKKPSANGSETKPLNKLGKGKKEKEGEK